MNYLRAAINPVPVGWNLATIRFGERRSYASQKATQTRRLRKLLRHAAVEVPHYRTAFEGFDVEQIDSAEGLRHLPILSRETVQASRNDRLLLADNLGPNSTRPQSTSGSSGIPVTVHNSEVDLRYLRATYLNDMLSAGLRPLDRIAYFRPSSFLPHRLQRVGIVPMFHVDTRAEVGRQADAFLQARPTFVTGLPNPILAVVDELRRRDIRYRGVRRVLFGGEKLSLDQRDRILSYFEATASEVYAAVETLTIARSCARGTLHVQVRDVVIEVADDRGHVTVENGCGEILVTRLNGEAMPLIRYRLGDRVRIEPGDCACGVGTPVVREILGRREDLIVDRRSRARPIDCIEALLLDAEAVSQFQAVQHRPGELHIRVITTAPSLRPGDSDQKRTPGLRLGGGCRSPKNRTRIEWKDPRCSFRG
jgi:phenylacetate-CoA ligase